MPDDASRPDFARADLQLMRAQGDALASDSVVDLVAAAAEHYASVLTVDGDYRAPGDPPPARVDVDHRVAAALDGAATAFTDAAARFRALAA